MLTILMTLLSTLLLAMGPSRHTQWNWTTLSCTFMFLTLLSLTLLPHNLLSLMPQTMTALDSLSSPLVSLTLWLSALMISVSSDIMKKAKSSKQFMTTIIILSMTLFLAFATNSLIMFYFMFEASLAPTLFLILKWGYQPERLQASLYMILYTLSASLPLLLMITLISYHNASFSMSLMKPSDPPFLVASPASIKLCWTLTILAFLVKMPLYTVHLWLPKAHVEAPIAGSMILAGVLLKLGAYGLMRISLLYPSMTTSLKSLLLPLALWGSTVSSLICLRQTDMKSLIAYSSVGHMGVLTSGIMLSSHWGLSGALCLMLAHGLSSSAMFSLANITYEMTKTRSLALARGLGSLSPSMMMWWFLFSSCNMSAPPTANLLGEALLMGAIIPTSYLLILALIPINFTTATYSLFLYSISQHGAPSKMTLPSHSLAPVPFTPLFLHLAPIILLTLKPVLILPL